MTAITDIEYDASNAREQRQNPIKSIQSILNLYQRHLLTQLLNNFRCGDFYLVIQSNTNSTRMFNH